MSSRKKFSLKDEDAFGDADLPSMSTVKRKEGPNLADAGHNAPKANLSEVATIAPSRTPSEQKQEISTLPQSSNAPGLAVIQDPPSERLVESDIQVATEVNIVWLHVQKMKVWKGNPRHVIDKDLIDDLIDDIRAHGQQHPVDVIEDTSNPGHYLIIGGQRRWLAISEGGINDGKILARIRSDFKNEEEILAAALTPQMHTAPLKDIDLAISLALSESGVRALSRSSGKNAGELSKLKQIGELPEPLISFFKIHASKFSRNFAYETVMVHGRCGLEVALNFAREIQELDLTIKKTTARKEAILGAAAGGGAPIIKAAKRTAWSSLQFPKFDGSLKMRESTGEVALNLKGLSPVQIESVRGAVEKILKEPTTDQ